MNISNGQKQRAGIVRALANEINIVFTDEPTGYLDIRAKRINIRPI
ncbi:MAG: ATP-binding cassette domain-containing protein [Spirochaetaceae bacterium]